jgi:aminoglycoside 3-N-acetyltransferase
MGFVEAIYKRVALMSPRIEVRLRQLYWSNKKNLGKYNPNVATVSQETAPEKVDFSEILSQLREWGIGEGSLLIVHSSYDSLQSTGLTPKAIIDELLKLVGEQGTLAMPVIRHFKESPTFEERLLEGAVPPVCKYHVMRTPVTTGIIPATMLRYPNAVISRFPLNPICAIGSLAKAMMEHNLEGDCPSPHGENSCWKFCLDHGALVCGLGTDLRHHNTMGHVAEEAFGDWYWSDEEWYDRRRFMIESPKEDPVEIEVKERKPMWGMLHQAELNRYHDLVKNGVLKSRTIGNVLLEFEESQKLIGYLRSRNKKGYPYFK